MIDATTQPDEKLCPFCAETIKAAAIKCRYCGSELAPADPGADVPSGEAPAAPPAPVAATPAADPPPTHTSRPSFLASFTLLKILVAVCLVLALAAGIAWWRAGETQDSETSRGAITSAEARDAGLAAATELTQKVLSYDWKTLDADIKESEAVLAPSFRSEYAKAMAGVKAQTVKNQVKLTASAVATSIVSASENKVVALVFVNQITTAKGAGNQRLDQNRVLVTLTRDGGEWRVSKMDAF